MFALAAAGLAIGNRDLKPEIRNQNNKSRVEQTNTTDIYTTNNSRKTRDHRESLGRNRFRDSRRFKDTGVVPRNYQGYEDWLKRHQNKRVRSVDFNEVSEFGTDSRRRTRQRARRSADDNSSDSEFSDNRSVESFESVDSAGSDDGYHGINTMRPDSVIDRMTSITNNRKFESCVAKPSKKHRNKYGENDTWVHQFDRMTFDNPGEAVSANSTAKSNARHGAMARLEMERQMEIDGGYSNYDSNEDGTYGIVHPESPDFIHENMQPFVSKGPSARQEEVRNDVSQRKLELFTGSNDNPDYRPKVERAPLFSPLIGAENIYGDPVRTDEYKSRYFPGREKRNEVPFQQVKVTPGLNIGYNAIGKQGYHDMYRVVPRGVDELRTLNNPKISYGSYTGPGQKGDKGPVLGRVGHYRAPRFRERGTKDMVRGQAYFSAPTVYGEYDPKNLATVNRGTKESMKIGPAAHYNEGNTPGKFRGNWRSSRKENYKYDHPRNIKGNEEARGDAHNKQAYVPDSTKRDIHGEYDRSGNAISGNREDYRAVNWEDVPDATRRNLHEEYDRSGNAISGNREDYRAVNWDDVPDATKRNIHDKYDRSGNAISGNREDYRAVNWDDVPDVTKRNIHEHFDRAGKAVTGNREDYRAVNWDDVPDPTKRNIHPHFDRAGKAVTGNREDYRAVNWDDVPDPTKRNIHPHFDRAGKAISGNREDYRAVNWDDVPDPTKRNIHDQFDRAGKAVSGDREDYRAVNWDDVPDPTKRNIHDQFDRAGKAVSGNREDYRAVNWDDVPDVTKRNIHDQFDRAGKAVSGNREDYRAVNWDDVPDPTKRNLHERYDRAGHVSGNREDYRAVDWDDVPDPTKRNLHEKYDRAGHVSGNREDYKAVNWDDVPDVTMREIHSRYDRVGHVSGNREDYKAVNWDDVPDVTMREIHPGARTANVEGNREGYRAVDWNDVPDATMREIHPGGRTANVEGNREGYHAVDWDDVPDVTMREIHPGGRNGAAQSYNKRPASRHQYMVMKTNAGKEALEEGRAPTKVGMEKGWTIDHTAFELRDLVKTKWRPGPGSDTMYTSDSLASINTRVPIGRYYINDRILAHTEENLQGNELVNNLIHTSISSNLFEG